MAQPNPTDATPDSTHGSTPEMAKLEIRKSADAELVVGGLRLVACRREVDVIDGGITLYVWSDGSPAGGDARPGAAGSSASRDGGIELVRMDLFRARPHYHAPAEKQEECTIDADAEGSIAWGIDALTTRAPELVEQAGFASIAAGLDRQALAAAGPAIQALFDGLGAPDEISYFEVPASVIESLRAPA